jgi:hypothetical protein
MYFWVNSLISWSSKR